MSGYVETLLPIRWHEPKSSYDVVIVGGGGHGLATAYYLATRHGIRNVAVLEADYIASGNTGRNTTIIRANYGIPEAVRFYQHSLEMYQGLEDETGAAILHQTRGIFWIAHTEMAMRTERARCLVNTACGARTFMVSPAELKGLVPQVDLTGGGRYPVLGASHHVEGATARHDRVAWAYAAGASERGVHVVQHTPVTGLLRDGERVVGVETPNGPIAAGVVLSAVGGRVTRMAAHAGVRLPVRTHPLHAFVTNNYAQGFGPILASTELACYVSRLADRARPDADRGGVRLATVVFSPVVLRRAAKLLVQDHATAAIPARPAHPADVGRDLRHLGGLLADHGRHRRRRFPDHDRLGDLGVQGDPGRRRRDGRVDRHGTAVRLDRAVRAGSLPARPRPGGPGLGRDPLMLWLACPRCGRRPLDEFTFGGERRTTPDWITDPDDRDFDEVWVFENPDGPTTERWFHAAGCRRWLTIRRDTETDTVLEVVS